MLAGVLTLEGKMSTRNFLTTVAASVLLLRCQRWSSADQISYIGEAANVGSFATTTYDSNGYDLYATTAIGTNTRTFDPFDGPFGSGTRLTNLPGFVTSITAPAQNASASGYVFYATINNPVGGQVEGGYTFSIASTPGVQNDLASIHIGSDVPSEFDIGMLENLSPAAVGQSADYPDGIRLRQANSAGDSGLITTNKATADFGAVDVYFFQIDGAAVGDTLTFSAVENSQNVGDGNYHATLAGVLFPSAASVREPMAVKWNGLGDGINWNNPNNWSDQLVPYRNQSITIPGGVPVVDVGGGAFSVGALTSASSIEVLPGDSLTLFGPAVINGSLTLDPGGAIDIQNSSLTINFSAGADPVATIRRYLRFAYDDGLWDGSGLTSSVVAAQVAANKGTTNGTYSIGYSDGNTDGSIGGVQPGQILIEPELVADANMDGKVDFNDLLILAQNVGSTNADWTHADFNFDGLVDFNDLLLLAQNINHTNGSTPLGEQLPASFEAQWQLAQAEVKAAGGSGSVPEPGMMSLLSVFAVGLLKRRRRNQALQGNSRQQNDERPQRSQSARRIY